MARRKGKPKKARKKKARIPVPLYTDHLERLQDKANWSRSKTVCTVCKGPRGGEPVYHGDDARICRDCAVKIFKRNAKGASLGNWTSRDFIESLSPPAGLLRRFTVLFRYAEAEERLAQTGPENLETIRRLLLDQLGHMDGHPLAEAVRTAAHEACVAVGEGIVDLLVSVRKPKAPWQFTANQVLTGGAINPEHPKVKAMLKAAAENSSPSVRICAARGVGLHDAYWAMQLLDKLGRDPNPLVREAVAQIRAGQRERAPQRGPSQKTPEPQPAPRKKSPPLTPLESAINGAYNVATLKMVYQTYLSSLFDEDWFDIDGPFSLNRLRKSDLVKALAEAFSHKQRFRSLYGQMPDGVKTVLDALVWEGRAREMSEFRGIDPPFFTLVEETRYGREIYIEKPNPAYFILPIVEEYDWRESRSPSQSRFIVSLPDEVRTLLKSRLAPPPEYHLEGTTEVKKTRFRFKDGDRVLAQIEAVSTFIRQDGLKFTKSGDRVLKNSLRQMVETCRLREFYPDVERDLDYLRGHLMANFLSSEKKAPLTEGTPEALKAAFDGFFSGETHKTLSLDSLLAHLKGMGYRRQISRGTLSERDISVRASLPKLLRNLPDARWVDVDTLLKHCRCRDIDLEAVHRSRYAGKPLYDPMVATPFLKAVLFFFAAFGLVEILYDRPRITIAQGEENRRISVWDGLRYVRPTTLGAFVAGKSETYEAAAPPETATVSLDDNRLLIHLHGRDPIKEMALSQIAERVAENLYKVSFGSFLQGCTTEAGIRQRKALFQQHIEAEPTGIWKAFLDDVEGKVDPLVPVRSMAVFRLKENQELISLVARDPELKQYILKAEGYHILIPHTHLSKVRNRLEAFGYLIQDLR